MTTTTPTPTIAVDIKTFALSHLVWIVAVVVALGLGRIALTEHDARIVADGQIKISEAAVLTLQQKITATNAVAAAKTKTIIKIVHDAQTPAQQIAAIPQLSNVELNARVVPALTPDGPPQVAVDLAPLVQELGQCRQDAVQLAAVTADLKNETAIAGQKQNEIVALKRKPKFWRRVASVAKTVGIGIGIGVLLGAHGL